MIYFLVNNDYQLFDVRRHLADLAAHGQQPALIEVPHNLRSQDRGAGFARTDTFETPLKGRGPAAAWAKYWSCSKQIRRRIQPSREDVLFLYTEYELLNHLLAREFKCGGARVYLIEDGGMATYLPLSLSSTESFTTREAVKGAMTRLIPGLAATRFHKANGIVFPWLEDSQLDGICLYRAVDIARKIPTFLIEEPPQAPLTREPGRVLFLNERIYDYYQTRPQFLRGLELILESLTRGFSEVLFKFHPSESAAWIGDIGALLQQRYPSIRVIEDKAAVETIIERYAPEVVASYCCTALLSLWGRGIQPLYLYHLFEEMASQKLFRQMTTLLSRWNYAFVDSFAAVRSGYRCGFNFDGQSRRTSLFELAAMGAGRNAIETGALKS